MSVDEAVGTAWRQEWSRVVGGLVRFTGRLDIAEDAVQEAFAIAVRAWRTTGIPDNPGAWLTTTARRRAVDRLRREDLGRRKSSEAALRDPVVENGEPDLDQSPLHDDQLRLILLCCHPALAPEAQVALTLRSVGGLSTSEIAKAFLVPEATLAQRLVRAKRKIVVAGISFAMPPERELPARLEAVRTVLYLVFNEGYASSHGDQLVRTDLCEEAIRLAWLLLDLTPDDPETLGLLALMNLQHSRRATRLDGDGNLVLLADQDRARWDRGAIEQGVALLDEAIALGRPGPLQLQAAIAALHALALSPAGTDWPQITALYQELARLDPSPVVALNHAVAISMSAGAAEGLHAMDQLAGELDGYYLFHAGRADLLTRLGRSDEAGDAYRRAIALAPSEPERRFLVGHQESARPN
ncbi:MAG: RNA polymerase sigma factor [Acidimicrobiia bacterium]